MEQEKFEKTVKFYPAEDKMREGGGIQASKIEFILNGENGTVKFELLTNWHLPHITEQLTDKYDPVMNDYHWRCRPMIMGIRYSFGCRKNALISSDKSFAEGQRFYDRLLRDGDDGVWDELIKFYHEKLNLYRPNNATSKGVKNVKYAQCL